MCLACQGGVTARHWRYICDSITRNWRLNISSPIPARNCRKYTNILAAWNGFLGQPILKLNPDRNFDFWLRQYNNFLPSPQSRWCTRQLKLRPLEQWLRPKLKDGDTIYSYVAIRSDEEYREGYTSTKERLIVRLPFKEAGIDKAGVLEILDGAGLGLPTYYTWRTS